VDIKFALRNTYKGLTKVLQTGAGNQARDLANGPTSLPGDITLWSEPWYFSHTDCGLNLATFPTEFIAGDWSPGVQESRSLKSSRHLWQLGFALRGHLKSPAKNYTLYDVTL
jgi:hypothetical protein